MRYSWNGEFISGSDSQVRPLLVMKNFMKFFWREIFNEIFRDIFLKYFKNFATSWLYSSL